MSSWLKPRPGTTIGTAIAAAMPPATASPAMASKAINQPTLGTVPPEYGQYIQATL